MVPNVTYTNIEFGGTNLKASNILFTNGVEDGWKWCSILDLPITSEMKAIEIDCPNCAHCVDLYDEKTSDDAKLSNARTQI